MAGAIFELKKSDQLICYGIVPENSTTGEIEWYQDKNADTQFDMSSILSGEYTLSEIQAPVGFAISEETWILTFSTNGGCPEITCAGQNVHYTEDVDEDTGVTTYEYIFKNTPIFDLPSAGSSGIFGYTMGGTLLLMAGTLILYKMKRKEVQGS